jgi:molybdopterin/thiamine biosynthesis adenylyltransferase
MTSFDRYDRQLRCAFLDKADQMTLSQATALVIGVGGLGSWTSNLLARAGIGKLRLVDDDVVQLVNLHRQDYYTEADIGQAKVDVAAERIAAINSEVAVETCQERLTANVGREILDGVDLILDGVDNFASRFIINDLAVATGTPWVFTGIVAAEGQLMVIRPGQTACLRCIMPAAPDREVTCMDLGVLGPAVAFMSARQSVEAIKLLTGQVDAATPCMEKYNLWTNTVQRLQFPTDPECVCCGGRQFDYWRNET